MKKAKVTEKKRMTDMPASYDPDGYVFSVIAPGEYVHFRIEDDKEEHSGVFQCVKDGELHMHELVDMKSTKILDQMSYEFCQLRSISISLDHEEEILRLLNPIRATSGALETTGMLFRIRSFHLHGEEVITGEDLGFEKVNGIRFKVVRQTYSLDHGSTVVYINVHVLDYELNEKARDLAENPAREFRAPARKTEARQAS